MRRFTLVGTFFGISLLGIGLSFVLNSCWNIQHSCHFHFSPNSQLLVVVRYDDWSTDCWIVPEAQDERMYRTVSVLDRAHGRRLLTLDTAVDIGRRMRAFQGANMADFLDDQRVAVVEMGGGAISMHDLEAGKREQVTDGKLEIRTLAAHCGKNLLALGSDREVWLFDVANDHLGDPRPTPGSEQSYPQLAFCPHADVLAVGGGGRLDLWGFHGPVIDPKPRNTISSFKVVNGIQFHPVQEQLFVTVGSTMQGCDWTGNSLTLLAAYSGACRPAISPDGKAIAVKQLERDDIVFDAEHPGKTIRASPISDAPYLLDGHYHLLEYSPDGRWLAVANGQTCEMEIREADTGKVIQKFALPGRTDPSLWIPTLYLIVWLAAFHWVCRRRARHFEAIRIAGPTAVD